MVRLLPPALTFALWLFCVIDVICARQDGIRHLGKNTWLLIVLFFPLVGSIAWLVAGRSQGDRPLTREQGAAPGFPEYERRGRFAAADSEADDAFLRQVRARAEEQRKRYDQQRRNDRLREDREREERGREASAD